MLDFGKSTTSTGQVAMEEAHHAHQLLTSTALSRFTKDQATAGDHGAPTQLVDADLILIFLDILTHSLRPIKIE
jgi:hypothetical protein